MVFIEVAEFSSIPEGTGLIIELDGKPVALFKKGDEVFAIDNTCFHRGGPLGEGEVEENVVTCPLHGWQYDITNGNCLTMPTHKLNTYKVKVENGKVLIEP